MKAIVLAKPGGIEELKTVDIEKPILKEGEVLVQVKAISINPVDVKTRTGAGVYGRINTESPIIIGWDIAGVVTEAHNATFKPGDEVFGMVNFPGHGKAYAQYVAVPANQLALKPANISLEQAAAATLTALTAYQALIKNANITPGQRVLVHAAAGGVGHFAVQIAEHVGAHVIGTSSAANRDFVLALGADDHIDYKSHNWQQSTSSFDFVLDTVGGDNLNLSIDVTKPGGSLISILGLNDERKAKATGKGVKGNAILVYSSGEDMKVIAGWLEKGVIKAHVAATFPFDKMGEAHLQVETGRTVGKVVVTVI
jgi:NADPH:quinone reductase-like Zn-dependent oxidoreductase